MHVQIVELRGADGIEARVLGRARSSPLTLSVTNAPRGTDSGPASGNAGPVPAATRSRTAALAMPRSAARSAGPREGVITGASARR